MKVFSEHAPVQVKYGCVVRERAAQSKEAMEYRSYQGAVQIRVRGPVNLAPALFALVSILTSSTSMVTKHAGNHADLYDLEQKNMWPLSHYLQGARDLARKVSTSSRGVRESRWLHIYTDKMIPKTGAQG